MCTDCEKNIVFPGTEDNSLYIQYSQTGCGEENWHVPFDQCQDIYMRQKVGESGTWTDKIKITGDRAPFLTNPVGIVLRTWDPNNRIWNPIQFPNATRMYIFNGGIDDTAN